MTTFPGAGLANCGRLWRSRTSGPSGNPLLDLRYNYDAVGNVTRGVDVPREAAGWPTTGFTFQDTFNSQDTATWTWSSYQTVPFNDGGNNVVKSSGTDANWNANFYRSAYSLTGGQGLQLRFQVDRTDSVAHFAIEANDATYRRFGVIANGGKLYVQYNDGGGWRYPADVLPSLQTSTWYAVRIVVDDSGRSFYVEAYQGSNPSVRGSYNIGMPTGKSWRFHHWLWRGNAYIDDYREFSTAGLTWTPDERLGFTYDALDRLWTGTTDGVGQGQYSLNVTYTAAGNIETKDGVNYEYDPAHRHAVTRLVEPIWGSTVASYSYDANGNMTGRNVGATSYTLTYDAENRLTGVSGGASAGFVYDGDGQRVKGTVNGVTTVYIGDYYEQEGSTIRKYYYAGGQRIAMREGSTLYYLLTDHLGSTAVTADASGGKYGELRYKAWGETRYAWGTTPTAYKFTGQRLDNSTGLYYYGARYYDAGLGRFVQPDTIVPEPGNSQALNRYSYTLNNPLKYIDPTGHDGCAPEDQGCWERRWYQAHGYEHRDGQRVYTGNYYFTDPDAARDLMGDIAAGRHSLRPGASFRFDAGRARISVEPRGQDNTASQIPGILGVTADIVDFGITSSFAGAYTLEQLLTALAGPPGAAAGFVVGETAYRGVQLGLFGVDVAGLAAVGFND